MILITLAITGLAATTMAAAASASRVGGMPLAAKGCIKVTSTIPVGYQPTGVGVNPKTDTIYVTDSLDIHHVARNVSAINGATKSVVAQIHVGHEPVGIAVDPRTNKAYVANVAGKQMTVVDGQTNKATSTIPLGFVQHAVTVNPKTNTVYAAGI